MNAQALRPPELALRAPLPREVASLADSLRSGQWNDAAPHNWETSECVASMSSGAQRNGERSESRHERSASARGAKDWGGGACEAGARGEYSPP